MPVQGTRHQFLAGAGLALDEHRGIARGGHADALVHLAHGFADADEFAVLLCIGWRCWRSGRGTGVGLGAQGALQHLHDRRAAHGLGQVVERAQAHGLDGARAAGVGGEHQHGRQPGHARGQRLQRLQPVHAGHALVQEDGAVAVALHLAQRLGPAAGAMHFVAQALQGFDQRFAEGRVVIDD